MSITLLFFTLSDWQVYSVPCSLYIPLDPISYSTDKENLFDNQEPLKLAIIFTIIITFTFDPRVIL